MTRVALALAALVTFSACSSATTGSSTARPDRNLITQEEIESVPVTSAYELIERLRPEFLRAVRGGGTANVYINGSPSGGINILNSIRASNVLSIRYVDAVDANFRYGRGNESGVIEVELVRGP